MKAELWEDQTTPLVMPLYFCPVMETVRNFTSHDPIQPAKNNVA